MSQPGDFYPQPSPDQELPPVPPPVELQTAIGYVAVTPGIRGWEKAEAADYDHPDVAFIGAHAVDYQKIYGLESPVTDEQRQAAENLVAGTDPGELWNGLGFREGRFTVSDLQQGFSKENNPDFAHRTGSQFHVVEDEQGITRLLKAAAGDRQLRQGPTLETVYTAQYYGEGDSMAAKVGQYLGYPTVPTELVSHQGQPYVSYEFIKDAVDLQEIDNHGDEVKAQVDNKAAVELRQVFNFVAGSFGDGKHQGVIDPATKTYYANDLNMSDIIPQQYRTPPVTTWKEFMDRRIEDPNFASWTVGVPPAGLDEETAAVLGEYVERMRSLDTEAAKAVLDPQTPMMQAKLDVYAQGLHDRARVIVDLYDQGYFTK